MQSSSRYVERGREDGVRGAPGRLTRLCRRMSRAGGTAGLRGEVPSLPRRPILNNTVLREQPTLLPAAERRGTKIRLNKLDANDRDYDDLRLPSRGGLGRAPGSPPSQG